MPHGKGKQYKNGWLIYDGEFYYGKREGKGKDYYNDQLVFEGEYKDDKRNGKGKEYYFGKVIFEGEYANGFRMNWIILRTIQNNFKKIIIK